MQVIACDVVLQTICDNDPRDIPQEMRQRIWCHLTRCGKCQASLLLRAEIDIAERGELTPDEVIIYHEMAAHDFFNAITENN